MNPYIDTLQPYPFELLKTLHSGINPPSNLSPISLSIGEPRHRPPAFIVEALKQELSGLNTYPTVIGSWELRSAAARQLERRYGISEGRISADNMVLPVTGTREALYSFAHAMFDTNATHKNLVLMPNPGYQIYEGAALLSGAQPYRLDTWQRTGFKPNFKEVPPTIWDRCQILYLCSPGNPTGAVHTLDELKSVIELAHRHNFIIAADECYADIYQNEALPPAGCLAAAESLGLSRFDRVVVFHSLSKRSSVPGLRSGIVAGDPALLTKYRLYRTYHGCAMPTYVQAASRLAWEDTAHVLENRARYQAKFATVLPLLAPYLEIASPDAGFYLWPMVEGDDTLFARSLYEQQNVVVLPGSFMARTGPNGNPGQGRIRISLVAEHEECLIATQRIVNFIKDNYHV